MSAQTTTGGGWQLQGNAAEAYEAYLVPVIFAAMSEALVAAAGVGDGDRVLDAACGTAVVARAAAGRAGPTGSVTGVDVNPDMLAVARSVTEGVRPPIRFEQADVTDLPFDDGAFTVVLCQQALQFFPDRVAALRELHRVTAPGGRLGLAVLRSLEHHPVYAVLARALGRHAGPVAEEMMGSPFALGDAGALREAAGAAGFSDVSVRILVGAERFPSVEELVRQEAASSPLAGPLGELDDAQRSALVADLERELAAYRDDDGIAFANETHVVLARR